MQYNCGVLLIPGLNMCPSGMDEIAGLFDDTDILVKTAALDFNGTKKQLRKKWMSSVADAFCALEMRCASVICIGFSLGSLLAVEWYYNLDQHRKSGVRLVLLSLPLSLRLFPRMMSILSYIPWIQFPSFSPRAVRVARFTSGSAYRALFSLKREVVHLMEGREFPEIIVVLSEQDELINSNKVIHFLSTKRDVIVVSVLPDGKGPRHLLVGSEYAGGVWQKVADTVKTAVMKIAI